jgi:hypothetical protein
LLALNAVLVEVARWFQERIGRSGLDERHARVASDIGVMPYLKQSARRDFYTHILESMNSVGTDWSAYPKHGELLRSFQEVGALQFCPEAERRKILKYLVLTFIGKPGGQTQYGNIRHVFYSNSASPVIREIVKDSAEILRDDLVSLKGDSDVARLLKDQYVARRFEELSDIVQG